MTAPHSTDVLIVGAGAAGLTLAVELARRGVNFHFIDKAPEAFRGSRGKGVQPRTQELFEDLGVLDRLVSRGGLYPPQRVYAADGSFKDQPVIESEPPTAAEPYQIALMAPQFITEGALRERLTELGHAPRFGCELIGFDQDDEGVAAQIAGPNGPYALRARYLIGADGGRSFVRPALNIEFPGQTLGVRAIVADLDVTGLSRDAWHRWGDMLGQISLCPLGGTEMFQMQGAVPAEGDIDVSVDGLNQLLAQRSGRTDVRITKVHWASIYNMNARLADQYRVGRVLLVGDAAHIHPPTGGQGLNTSVQDAYNLGWKLAAVLNGASADLVDTYEEERREVAAGVLGLSTKLLQAAREQNDLRRGREVRQLDLGYPTSSLRLEAPSRNSGRGAGDRAPDAPLRGAAGQPTRMFSLLKGTHSTLIGFGVGRGEGPSPRPGLHIHRIGEDGDLFDSDGAFEAAYGLERGDWLLVRPDGYVGAVVDTAHLDALELYLERLGLGAGRPTA